jgi:hypothetical protein
MKERILKIGVTLFLVAVVVVAGVLASHPGKSQAAAKGTTYQVVLQKSSPVVSLVSINGGAPGVSGAQSEMTTFQMVVEAKAKTEKLPTGPASYYPVTIIAKSYKAPTQEFPMVGGGMAVRSSLITKDAKGKLYISGGDVDVNSVLSKKLTPKIGDGTVDPAGSMIIEIQSVSNLNDKATGKFFMSSPSDSYYTTGKSYCVVKGTKSKLEGKAMPNDDTTKSLNTPLVGKPIDLAAGTGTLVVTTGFMNVKNKMLGLLDNLTGQMWVMNITKL